MRFQLARSRVSTRSSVSPNSSMVPSFSASRNGSTVRLDPKPPIRSLAVGRHQVDTHAASGNVLRDSQVGLVDRMIDIAAGVVGLHGLHFVGMAIRHMAPEVAPELPEWAHEVAPIPWTG